MRTWVNFQFKSYYEIKQIQPNKTNNFEIYTISNTFKVNEMQLLFKLDLLPWGNYCLHITKLCEQDLLP